MRFVFSLSAKLPVGLLSKEEVDISIGLYFSMSMMVVAMNLLVLLKSLVKLYIHFGD